MSVKFNNLGQWSLVGDGGNTLIKGFTQSPNAASSRHEKPAAKTGADEFAKVADGKLPEMGPKSTQPTDEELFGGGVVTEEMAKARQEEWEKLGFSHRVNEARKPIDHLNKPKHEKLAKSDWGNGTSFNSMLSKEELQERSQSVAETPSYIAKK